MPLGESWVNASYDCLFRFGTRPVTNKVALILMNEEAHLKLRQERGKWDRRLHAQLLDKLTEDHCSLVVFDVFFEDPKDPEIDKALASAIRRNGHVILAAKYRPEQDQPLETAAPGLQDTILESAVGWGFGTVDRRFTNPAKLIIPRRHWPFPAPNKVSSLPWTAAERIGARLNQEPKEQWLRYYGENGGWDLIKYHNALSNTPSGFFKDKVVFIGNWPTNDTVLGPHEPDKFGTPYTCWTGNAVGGVMILATTFLNLVNHDWLMRPPVWVEALAFTIIGAVLGLGLSLTRTWIACAISVSTALGAMIGTAWVSYNGNTWFPWFIVSGGQVPCALAWALVTKRLSGVSKPSAKTVTDSSSPILQAQNIPDAPDYELFDPPFGEGAYGKVWLARNAIGQWQALKAVYLAKFGQNAEPYDREFRGIKRYKPISDGHPGLLRVDFVSRKKREGYFYYVMELGDAQTPGWEDNPNTYKPSDLASIRDQAEGARLAVLECVRIGLVLAEALDFLHRQGLTHRDIKPQNIIFVQGRPKLADVGLVTDIQPTEIGGTWVGTPGFMPPPPEPPGTRQADIYALGMVLYVISTGRGPAFFPELSTTLVEQTSHPDFVALNRIITRACDPDRAERYGTAVELLSALQEAQKDLDSNGQQRNK